MAGITLVGGEALDGLLKRLGEELGSTVIAEACFAGADQIAVVAQSLAPRRTGRLAGGIHAELTVREIGYAEAVAGPNKPEFYGHFVERGTRPHEARGKFARGQPAQPFMEPAFDQSVDEIVAGFGTRIREAVDRHGAG